MGIRKHDELDDQHGSPKFVQEAVNKATRKEAAKQKARQQQASKANQRDGNGGKR
jgi:hypothetical protein